MRQFFFGLLENRGGHDFDINTNDAPIVQISLLTFDDLTPKKSDFFSL